jgi:hypothetical protein
MQRAVAENICFTLRASTTAVCVALGLVGIIDAFNFNLDGISSKSTNKKCEYGGGN